MAELSVIIPYVNEYPQILFTIQSIAADLRDRVDFEIVTVNNYCDQLVAQLKAQKRPHEEDKSSLAIKATAQKQNPWLIHAEYTDKLSHWNAKRVGVACSSGKYLFFVDSHVALARDSLYGMLQYYKQHDVNGSMHLPLTYKILESRKLIYKLITENFDNAVLDYSFTKYREEEEPYEVPCMSCCGVLISRKVYEAMGGWSPELGIYGGGENFFNFTLSVLGMKKWIYTKGVCFHHGEKRAYHYLYDDYVRNKLIANYIYGGREYALKSINGGLKGRPEVLQSIYKNVELKCRKHREHVKKQQKVRIEDWVNMWLKTA
jgi:glycosyltransferase involved in cell wall biosynthesis